MDNIGLDLHQRESQVCILTDDGEVIERHIRTSPEWLTALLGGRPSARILLEASTESEWVARHLETLEKPTATAMRPPPWGTWHPGRPALRPIRRQEQPLGPMVSDWEPNTAAAEVTSPRRATPSTWRRGPTTSGQCRIPLRRSRHADSPQRSRC
jgi:hypothetical protein